MKKDSTMVRLSKSHLEKLKEMAALDERSATVFVERLIDAEYKKTMGGDRHQEEKIHG